MFSKACEYAIRAILYIAVFSGPHKRVGIERIVKELNIPAHFLRKILQSLTKKHVLSSVKGPNGGFYMTDKQMDKTLLDVVEAIDGLEIFYKCGLGLKSCSDEFPCPVHHEFKPYRDRVKKALEKRSIREVAGDLSDKKYFLENEIESQFTKES